MKRIKILGCKFSLCQRAEVDDLLLQHALGGGKGYVCVSNVHTTMMAFTDPDYLKIQNDSFLTVPDGMPLVWAMNLLGEKGTGLQDRVRGPDLMRRICNGGVALGVRHYLYGGSEKTLAALRVYLQKKYPGIAIVGEESPPFRPWTSIELQEVSDRVKNSGAHFLWVGLGAPKQERWMYEQREKMQCVMLGVGAAFDLLPGVIREAPVWMQRMGLEWVYRFCQEPGRMWRRYLWNNPAFLFLLIIQFLKGKLFSQSHLCEIRDREEMGDL